MYNQKTGIIGLNTTRNHTVADKNRLSSEKQKKRDDATYSVSLLLQLALDAVDSAFFYAADLGLGDAYLLGDLHLGLAHVVAQGEYLLLAVGELFQGFLEGYLLEPVVVVALIADLIHDVDGIRAVAEHRLVEGQRLDDGLESQHDAFLIAIQLFGYLLYGRLAAEGVGQLLFHLHRVIGGVAHRTRDMDSGAVAEISPQLAHNHRDAVGRKSDVEADVEIIYGFYQTYHPDLKEIVEVLSPAGEPLDNAQNEPEITVNHLFTGAFSLFRRAGTHLFQQFSLFILTQYLQLRGINSAYLDLVILQKIPPR